jgi:hypothetical protein
MEREGCHMGLDLSKERDRQPRLGRGKVPDEIKRRLRGEKTPPHDEGHARLVAKTRRLRKEGKSLEEELRRSLREVGGPWTNPSPWVPKFEARRREWEDYLRRLDEETLLPENVLRLRNLMKARFRRLFQPGANTSISVAYNFERRMAYFTFNGFTEEVPDELLRRSDDVENIARELGERLLRRHL